MAMYEGTVEGFRTTPTSALNTNSVVVQGAMIGVTRQNLAANETGLAYMTGRGSHYTLTLASTATGASTVGTLVKADSNGKIVVAGSGDTAIGCLYSAIASGDTEADVLIFPCTVKVDAVASNVAAATAISDPAGDSYTATELKTGINGIVTTLNGLLTALKTAGIMTADAST